MAQKSSQKDRGGSESASAGKLPMVAASDSPRSPERRRFLRSLGTAGGAAAVAAAGGLDSLLARGSSAIAQEVDDSAGTDNSVSGSARRQSSYLVRVNAAKAEEKVPIPRHKHNGDESLYPHEIGNFSKGLPHDASGEVKSNAYATLLKAVQSGKPSDFAKIPLGGIVPLVDPQAGLAFDLEGTDPGQLSIPPFPALASAHLAAQAVEIYWLAYLRDLPFSQYGTDAEAQAAIAELDGLPAFDGPRAGGHVTAETLFRGFTAGDVIGPYVSQFFYLPFTFGALATSQQYKTHASLADGGADYLIDFASWLNCRNGVGPFAAPHPDPTPRYIRSGRDLAAWVHMDVLYQAYLTAVLVLLTMEAPLNPSNPYPSSLNQTGFGTFGAPHIQAFMGEVATRALKAEWYEKWFVHRALRPEEFGGLVHLNQTRAKNYPLDPSILNSEAVAKVFQRNGTYLLPIAYPEGCPQHPSYASGHATVAGACATIIKWFFDETFVIPHPMVPSDDGLILYPYTGSDAGEITAGGKINKIAANVGIGRNFAGLHWRSDYQQGLLLGEAVAISILSDQANTYNEDFHGATFTRFDGTPITI